MRRRISLPQIPEEHKNLLLPFVIILIIIISVFGGFKLFSNLRQTYQEITKLEQEIAMLASKQEILSHLDPRRIQQQLILASRALPEKSGVLPALARIRDVATGFNVEIVKVRVSGGVAGKIPTSQLTVDVEGGISSIGSFLANVEKSIPIIRATKGKLSVPRGGRAPQAALELETFRKKIPTELPAVTSAVQQVTREEEQLLTNLEEFKERRVSTASAAPGGSRSNPFSF